MNCDQDERGATRTLLALLLSLLLSGCASGGIPQETVDRLSEPLKWQMLQNPSIPKGPPIRGGPSIIQVVNPVRDTVLVIFQAGQGVGWFFVDNGETSHHNVQNGSYQMFFIYSDEPDALYKGDDIALFNQISTITLQLVPHGNYNIRRVR